MKVSIGTSILTGAGLGTGIGVCGLAAGTVGVAVGVSTKAVIGGIAVGVGSDGIIKVLTEKFNSN